MLLGIVLLHPAQKELRLLRLSKLAVDRPHRLQKINILFQPRPRGGRNQLHLCKRVLVAAGAVQRGKQTLPRLSPVWRLTQNLLVKRIGPLRVVALQIHTGKLQPKRRRGLLPGGHLLRNRLLENILRHIEPLLRLVDRRHSGLKPRIAHRLGIACCRHAFKRLQRLRILIFLVLYADQSLPGLEIVPVLQQYLAIEARRLIQMVGSLQETRVLQFGLYLYPADIGRKRQIERSPQHTLCVRIASHRGVGRRERT